VTAAFSPKEFQAATGGRWVGRTEPIPIAGVYTDTRKSRPGAVFVALEGPNFDGHAYLSRAAEQGAGALLAAERYLKEHAEILDLPVAVLAVEDPLYALGQLAQAYRRELSPRTVAVTGSVGKTTVKDLLVSVVGQKYRVHGSRANYNNLIGLPLEILEMKKTDEVLIVECGADRPGEIGRLVEICQPQIGVVTHIVPCHLERLGSTERIAEEKGRLLAGLSEPDPHAVVNGRAAERDRLLQDCRAPVLLYGSGGDTHVWAEHEQYDEQERASFEVCSEENRYPVQLQIAGAHQVDNALAAAAVARLLDLPGEAVQAGLAAYEGAWGRMQRVILPDGAVLIEDVYNSNPSSMQAALDYLARQRNRERTGVFGEMWDLGPDSEHWHWVVGRQITRDHVETLIAVGPLAQGFIEGALKSGRPPKEIHAFAATHEALQWLRDHRRSDSLIFVKGSRGMKMETITEGLKA